MTFCRVRDLIAIAYSPSLAINLAMLLQIRMHFAIYLYLLKIIGGNKTKTTEKATDAKMV